MQRFKLALLPSLLLIGCGGGSDKPTVVASPNAAPAAAAGSTPAASTPTPAAPAATSSAGGTWDGSQGVAEVMGTISFEGVAPERKIIDMGADAACHGDPVSDESIIVNDGKLQNVFVHVTKVPAGLTYPKGTGSVSLSQEGCVYKPHVLGLQKGQTLSITNDDGTTHNVHSYSKRNRGFNKSQPQGAAALETTYNRSEGQFAIKCDIHPWMSSFVCVTDYPFFAVSAADGTYNLGKLPPGEYTISAEHEVFDSQTATVTVSASGASTVDFTFKAK